MTEAVKDSAHSLTVSRRIRATPERLFRAWTDPELLRHWWRMSDPGWSFAGASIDLRIGGTYRLAMTAPDGRTHEAIGVYREIVPPARLSFTWDWADPSFSVGDTLVTVEFIPVDDRATEVTITHSRFADAERVAGHEHGWNDLLTLIEQHFSERQA